MDGDSMKFIIENGGAFAAACLMLIGTGLALWRVVGKPFMLEVREISKLHASTATTLKEANIYARNAAEASESAANKAESSAAINLRVAELLDKRCDAIARSTK